MTNIVLVHGYASSSVFWSPIKKSLNGIVHNINLPQMESPTIKKYADFVNQYIKNNKLENIILIGHSMGASVISLIENKNINKYIFLSPHNPYINSNVRSWLLPKNINEAKDAFINLSFFSRMNDKQLTKISQNFLDFINSRKEEWTYLVDKSILNDSFKEELKNILIKNNKNIFIISGENDKFVPKESLLIMKRKFNLNIEFISECGHSILSDQSQKTLNSILKLI